MLKLFKKFRGRKLSLDQQIKAGIAQRGRTGMGGSIIHVTNQLTAKHIRNGEVIDERIEKNRKVTTAFVNFIVDQLIAETSGFGDFKYHDSGVGVGAESAADTALGTPCGDTRDAGTQIEGDETYEYKSVATHTYDEGLAITEHGLFNASADGILMDRTVFSAINVVAADKIEFTFTIQFAAEA